MSKNKTEKKKRSTLSNLWRIALAIVGVIAVANELQKPADQRTWHGTVADFIPYDFRFPTVDRFKATYWNPDGPIITGKVWGVGWALNVGAVKERLGF